MGILLSIQGDVDYRAISRRSILKRRLDPHMARKMDYGLRYEIRVKVLAGVDKAVGR